MKINFKKTLNILLIVTILTFALFILLVLLQNQIANIGFLEKLNKVISFKNVDNFQDVLVVLGMLPKMLVILFLIFILKKSESNNKNTFSSNVVQIIFGIMYTYFIYINLFSSSWFTKYIHSTFISYQLINILLIILFLFGIIYTINKLYNVYKRVKQKSPLDIVSNYEVYFYPIIVIMLIYLTINIVNALTLKYIIYQLLAIFSLQSLIDITSIISLPLSVNLSQVLPAFIIDFFNNFGITFNFSLSDLNIAFINNLFDNLVLSNIDGFIDNFILDKVNLIFFKDFNSLIILFILNISIIINEVIKKYNKLINIVILILMGMIYFKIDSLIANFCGYISLILSVMFIGLLIRENFANIKKFINKNLKKFM